MEVSHTLNDIRQLFVIDAFLPRDYGFGGRSGALRATGEREYAMSQETVTRAQLSEAVYQEVGLSRNESADLVEMSHR